jgi:hypothetical protein
MRDTHEVQEEEEIRQKKGKWKETRPRRRARRNNQNKSQQIATRLTISNLTYGRDPEQKPADVAQSGQKDQT